MHFKALFSSLCGRLVVNLSWLRDFRWSKYQVFYAPRDWSVEKNQLCNEQQFKVAHTLRGFIYAQLTED